MQIFQFNCLTIEWVGADSNCARCITHFIACLPVRADQQRSNYQPVILVGYDSILEREILPFSRSASWASSQT